MTTGAMATAAVAAMLLYYLLRRSLSPTDGDDVDRGSELSKSTRPVRRRVSRRPAQAPATWSEVMATLAETVRFMYSETLGKWPIGDLTFGINYFMRRQGNLQVASVYAGNSCVQLKGPEIAAELIHLLRLLTLCMLFSKKPFPVFLDSAGYSQEDVLLQEPKAGLLKPAFTIICDRSSKCFLLLIRGTHSIKDTLTAATGAVVPFHHSVVHEGGVSNLVLGYAHCGMVAAARWIAKFITPCLLNAVAACPDFKVKIVGHSLGGGTAALLTYILRERKEFSSSTCVAFAPAACMTWDLAESGKGFITTVINGSDLVPTFSTASLDDLRSEVTASSWLNDMRDQVENTRFLNVFYRSASALGSRLPSISSARARVASAGALLRPVSSSTQVVMKRAQNVAWAVGRTRSSLPSWSCMGARRRSVGPIVDSKVEEDSPDPPITSRRSSEIIIFKPTGDDGGDSEIEELDYGLPRGSDRIDAAEEDRLIPLTHALDTSIGEDMTQDELLYELEKELNRECEPDIQAREEEEAAVKEITEEESVVLADAVENKTPRSSDVSETHRFYPPGRIMHIVAVPRSDADATDDCPAQIGVYETPRYLYAKLRLSRTMVNDHYMPVYKKMMELLISELEKDVDVLSIIL